MPDLYEYLKPEYRDEDEEIRRAREAIQQFSQPPEADMSFTLEEAEAGLPVQPEAPASLDELMQRAAGTMGADGYVDEMAIQADVDARIAAQAEADEAQRRARIAALPRSPARVGGAMIGGPMGQVLAAPTLGGQRRPENIVDRFARERKEARMGALPIDILGGLATGLAGRPYRGSTLGEIRAGMRGQDLLSEMADRRRQRAHEMQLAKLAAQQQKQMQERQLQARQEQARTQMLADVYNVTPDVAMVAASDPVTIRGYVDGAKRINDLQKEARQLEAQGRREEAKFAQQQAMEEIKHGNRLIEIEARKKKARTGAGMVRAPLTSGQVAADPDVQSWTAIFTKDGESVPEEAQALFATLARTRKSADRQRIIGDLRDIRRDQINEQKRIRKEQRDIEVDVSKLAKDAEGAASLLDTITETQGAIQEATQDGDIAGVGLTGYLAERVPFGKKALTPQGRKLRQQLGILNEVWARARTGAAISMTEEDRFNVQTGLDPDASDDEMLLAIDILKRWATAEKAAKEAGKTPEAVETWNRQRQERRRAAGLVGPRKQVAKKEYSKSRNQTRITYADGSTEIVDGRQ